MRIDVSVVIPTYKRPQELQICLKSVLSQTLQPAEIIIADDNPQSQLEKTVLLKYKEVRYLKNPANLGLVLNKNRAAFEADCPIIVNVDDDVVLEKHYLERVIACFKDKTVGAVSGQLIEDPDYKRFNLYYFLLRLPFFILKKTKVGKVWPIGEASSGFEGRQRLSCDWLGGGALALRRDVFARVKGRDLGFKGSGEFEETDLTFRIKKLGFKLIFEPTAVAHHLRSPKRCGKYHFSFSANEVYFYLKNSISRTLWEKVSFVLYHFLWQLLVNLVFGLFNPRHFLQIAGKFAGVVRARRQARSAPSLRSGVSIFTGIEGCPAKSVEKISRYYIATLEKMGFKVQAIVQGKSHFLYLKAQIARYLFYPLLAKRTKTRIAHILSESDAHLLCFLPENSIKILTCYDLCPKETRFWHLINRALEYISRRALKKADFVFVPSEFVKKSLVKYGVGREKIIVSLIGYDNKIFYPLPKRISRDILGLPQDKKILLHVGTEHPRKNTHALFEVFSQINKKGDYLLIRLGRCRDRKRLVKLGIDNSVRYFSGVPEAQLGYFYSSADLLVFPSLCEGFGMPLIEAFGCGVPVACSDIPVFREIAADAALFFKPTARGVQRAIVSFFKDSRIRDRLRGQGLKRARDFSWDDFSLRYAELFEILIRSCGLSKISKSR